MKNTFVKSLVAVAALALTLGASAQAEELKIGYVNGDRVLREAAPAKAAQVKLETEFKKRESDLNDIGTKLRQAFEKLEKDGPTISEAERNRRQRDLGEQQREFERKRRELLEDLNQRKNEEMWPSASVRTRSSSRSSTRKSTT
jgi:outer membrane protein